MGPDSLRDGDETLLIGLIDFERLIIHGLLPSLFCSSIVLSGGKGSAGAIQIYPSGKLVMGR